MESDGVKASEFNATTMKNKDGNYPKWMSRKKITKVKAIAKKKTQKKKKKQ